MKHFTRWPLTIFAFITMVVLLGANAGIHRGDWWFYKLFAPVPARDVHVTSVEDFQIEATYIPSGCELVSMAAITTVGKGHGQIPVYDHTEKQTENGHNSVIIDTDLFGISFDQLKLYALWNCNDKYTRRLFATLYGRTGGPAHQYYVGPEGGYTNR